MAGRQAKKEQHEFKDHLGYLERLGPLTNDCEMTREVSIKCSLSSGASEPGQEFRNHKIHILCFSNKRNQKPRDTHRVTVGKARLETRVFSAFCEGLILTV